MLTVWFEQQRRVWRCAAIAPMAALPVLFSVASGDQAPRAQAPPAPSGAERVTVPFSDPARPGLVRVGLVTGSITVKGYDGRDVIVEVRPSDDEGEEDRDRRREKGGLRRVPNVASGLTVEEENNEMRIGTSMPNRSMEIVVQVPIRTSLKLNTVNDGRIVVDRVEGDLEVSNTNGPVTLTNVSGSVVAHALNDDVKVTLRQVSGKSMSFSSLNGDIDVTLHADIKANVRLETAMGEIYSDFDIDLQPALVQQTVEDNRARGGKYKVRIEKGMTGRINGGGPEITFKNFNGDIHIRKAR
jgi:hypothetical protein